MVSCNTTTESNSTQCRELVQEAADKAVLTALVVNVVVSLLALLLLVYLRPLKALRAVYRARRDIAWRSWWLPSSEVELEVRRGLDEAMYLRVLRAMGKITAFTMATGLLVLAPVHATAGGTATGTSVISQSNVPSGSHALAADVVVLALNSLFALWVLRDLYRDHLEARLRCTSATDCASNYAVVVRGVPSSMSGADVATQMDAVYPGHVSCAQVAVHAPHLWQLLAEREAAGLKLEAARASLRAKGRRATARATLCGPTEDAITLWTRTYDSLSQRLEHEQQALARESTAHAAGVAFVTFKTVGAAKVAAQTLLRPEWTLSAAPEPTAVQWTLLHLSPRALYVRRFAVNVAVVALIFLWMIPVGFATSFSNLHTLLTVLPFLGPLLDLSPTLNSLIAGLLPGLVVIIFFAILVSVIITSLARAQGHVSVAWTNGLVFRIYFSFLFFNVFFGSMLSAGVLSMLPQLLERPLSIFSLTSRALPAQGPYFVAYIAMLLSGFALELLRPAPLVVRWLLPKLLTTTKRDRRALNGPWFFSMHVAMALHCLVFTLLAVYCTLNPFVTPFALLYFVMAYVSARNQFAYVYTQAAPGHGLLFPSIFNRLVLAVAVAQLVNAAVMLSAHFWAGAGVVLALVPATALFWRAMDAHYRPLVTHGTLALELAPPTSDRRVPHPDTYAHPTLRPPLFQAEAQVSLSNGPRSPCWWPLKWVDTHGNAVDVKESDVDAADDDDDDDDSSVNTDESARLL